MTAGRSKPQTMEKAFSLDRRRERTLPCPEFCQIYIPCPQFTANCIPVKHWRSRSGYDCGDFAITRLFFLHIFAAREQAATFIIPMGSKPGPHQQQCRSNVRLCRKKGRNFNTKLVRHCCRFLATMSNVASTLLLVWTGFKVVLGIVACVA